VQTHFPSGDGSDLGVGLVLAPFRGVRYDLSRVGGLANVTSPPYDVIGPGSLERLLAASPYNVVRLILPTGAPGGGAFGEAGEAGEVASARLRDWLAEGALAVDDSPALYVYEQRTADWVQRGLIGLVAVGTDAVHPHEGVMAGPVAGRRELMKKTRTNLEPILLVYNGRTGAGGSGKGAASRLTDLTADGQAPLACAVTDDGVTHRLWAVTDPDAQADIAADLATRTALIADGHHRYAAYRELRAEMSGADGDSGPWDYGLAFLVDADEYPLRLGAIHRVLPGLPLTEAVERAAAAFTVTAVTASTAFERLAAAGESGTAFLLAGEDGYWLLTDPDQRQVAAAMPAAASDRWRALDAAVMQELLLAQLWLIKDNVRDVLISHDAAEAVRMAADSGGTAVICNPMPLAAVMDIAAHGEKVPRKSTSFGPKPRTGLVLRAVDARLALRVLRGGNRVGGRGLGHRVVDAEYLVQAGDPEDPQDAALRAHQVDPAVVRTDPLQAADEHAEAGRVEEVDAFHVHDQLIAARLDEADQFLSQLGSGVNVDLAANSDDCEPRGLGVHIERELHLFSLSCCLGQ
jgi:uncharacterized protein (DUF1015 family)